MSEREAATFALWRRVNEIACSTENADEIRKLLAEARVEKDAHVGKAPSEFTPLMVAEWCLGQWVDMIESGSPFLNTARNVSVHQYELNAPDGATVVWPKLERASAGGVL